MYLKNPAQPQPNPNPTPTTTRPQTNPNPTPTPTQPNPNQTRVWPCSAPACFKVHFTVCILQHFANLEFEGLFKLLVVSSSKGVMNGGRQNGKYWVKFDSLTQKINKKNQAIRTKYKMVAMPWHILIVYDLTMNMYTPLPKQVFNNCKCKHSPLPP